MASSGEAALLGGSVGDARAPPLPWKLLALLCAALAVAWCAVRALEWAWWRPRRLARALRSQGLCGTSYRSLAGDAPLTEELNREARSRPLPLGCHDVAPRAMPLFHQTMKEHGTYCTHARCFPFVPAGYSSFGRARARARAHTHPPVRHLRRPCLVMVVSKFARSTGPVWRWWCVYET
jgi:hypothetical protein